MIQFQIEHQSRTNKIKYGYSLRVLNENVDRANEKRNDLITKDTIKTVGVE